MSMIQNHYDCIVIGGGPAGSTVAALVAESGHSTLLLERDSHPRFHVGESLMPETYWVFKRLGVLDQMKASSFVRKVSVQFVSETGKESRPFFFDEHDPEECSTTWQVERSKFDEMLFRNAAVKGADCHEGTRVLEVLFDNTGAARGVKLQTAEGTTREVSSRVVVDATGQQTLLANALGIKRMNPDLKKASIWSYFRGAERDSGKHGGGTILLHTKSREAWFWSIPLSADVTSVGVVGDNDYLLKQGKPPEQVFGEQLTNVPAMRSRLINAERIEPFRVIKEFSYLTDRAAGDGWTLVGDAWGFVDPVYSAGVYFALKSGEMAADAIVEGLTRGDTSAKQLGSWNEEFSSGVHWIRKLIGAYYTDCFSFGRFMKSNPEEVGPLTDLLIGRVFHENAGKIFEKMDPMLQRTETP